MFLMFNLNQSENPTLAPTLNPSTSPTANATATSTGLLAVALGEDSIEGGMLLRGMATLASDPGNISLPLYLSETTGKASGRKEKAKENWQCGNSTGSILSCTENRKFRSLVQL